MPLLIGAVVLAASYGAGFVVTLGGRIPIEDGLRRRTTVFAVGFAVLALLALLFGTVGVFRPAALDPVALGFGAVGVLTAARETRGARQAWTDLGKLRWLVAATVAVVVLDAIFAMAPPTAGDALAYHLTAPKLWLHAHRMSPIWWEWQTFQAFATEMHFAYAQALWNGASAVVVGAGFGGLSAVCVYGFTRELAGRAAAAVAALLWVAQGMFLWEASGAFVELALSAFVALAFWHLVVYLRSGALLDATLAGLALGIAASTKVHALVFAPALLVGLLARPRRRAAAALAACAGVAVVLPWYVRAGVLTGNPIYPLVFGGKYWDSHAAAEYANDWAGYGIRGIWHLPFFPLEFLVQSGHYERGYGFSPALFVLPLVALAFRRRWVVWLAAGEVAYLLVWWQEMHQVTRYLLPGLALSTALSGYSAVLLWQRHGWARRFEWGLGFATLAPFAVITVLFAAQVLPGSFGTESTGSFVQRLTGSYEALHWLSANLPRGGRVLVFDIRNLYWLDRPYVRASGPLLSPGEPLPVVEARMHQYDVRYLVAMEGSLPRQLLTHSRLIRTLRITDVTSRTLGRISGTPEVFGVYAWCAGQGDPCSRTARPSRRGPKDRTSASDAAR
jgi:hypothetical protein